MTGDPHEARPKLCSLQLGAHQAAPRGSPAQSSGTGAPEGGAGGTQAAGSAHALPEHVWDPTGDATQEEEAIQAPTRLTVCTGLQSPSARRVLG